MQKQELIHVHGLLTEVQSNFEEYGMHFDASAYDEMDILPTALTRSKEDHETAVWNLVYSLADATAPAEVGMEASADVGHVSAD